VADAVASVHPIDRRVVVPGQAGWTRATAADGTVDIDDARPHLDEKALMSVHAKGSLPAYFRPTRAETLVTFHEGAHVRVKVLDTEGMAISPRSPDPDPENDLVPVRPNNLVNTKRCQRVAAGLQERGGDQEHGPHAGSSHQDS
jgi:hypothetical protein